MSAATLTFSACLARLPNDELVPFAAATITTIKEAQQRESDALAWWDVTREMLSAEFQRRTGAILPEGHDDVLIAAYSAAARQMSTARLDRLASEYQTEARRCPSLTLAVVYGRQGAILEEELHRRLLVA